MLVIDLTSPHSRHNDHNTMIITIFFNFLTSAITIIQNKKRNEQ